MHHEQRGHDVEGLAERQIIDGPDDEIDLARYAARAGEGLRHCEVAG